MVDDEPACCAGSRDDGFTSTGNESTADTPEFPEPAPASPEDERTDAMVRIDGGPFIMGTDDNDGFSEDGEGPARTVTVDPFYIDKYAVTNAQFLEFVRETGYTTDAERYGWSFVFEDFVTDEAQEQIIQNVDAAPWWLAVEGATWLSPYGPGSNVIKDDLLTHPVTHLSWRDAQAYADWAGKRLPAEAEWECAARGGLEQRRFPWGDELTPDGEHRCNVWQGEFPEHNTRDDGHLATAPVNEYDPNGFGLYNTVGNVWEWCHDRFSPDYHETNAYDTDNPTGPPAGNQRVMRGGSYLCHRSWCNRYRVAARSKNTPDSSTGNIGFRCVVNAVVR